MKNRSHILERMMEQADLPDEPLPGQPLLELSGDHRVLIENHCGVTEYTEASIRIRVQYGQLWITGSGLQMSRITGSQLVISGRIHGIQLCRRECK